MNRTLKDLREVQEYEDLKNPGDFVFANDFSEIILICTCGEEIYTDRDRWEIITKDPLTIVPSIYHNNQKCCAHFFITAGKVVWV